MNPATASLHNIIIGGTISALAGLIAAFVNHLLATKRQEIQLQSASRNLEIQMDSNRKMQETTWERTSELERNKQLYADRREIYVELLSATRKVVNEFGKLNRKELLEISEKVAHLKEVALLYAEAEVAEAVEDLVGDAKVLCSFGICTIQLAEDTDKSISAVDMIARLSGAEYESTHDRYQNYLFNLSASSEAFYHSIRRELRISDI